jgi:hypothetical protein
MVLFSYLPQDDADCRYQPQSTAPVWTYQGASFVSANYWSTAPNGRPSSRIESKTSFTEVLIISEFNHVPGGFPPLKMSLTLDNVEYGRHFGRRI